MSGYVYIGFDQSGRGFKIGKSKNTERREKEIRHMNPSFKILAIVEVENSTEMERHYHGKFEDKRIIGEWFDLSASEVSDMLLGKLTPEQIIEITGQRK